MTEWLIACGEAPVSQRGKVLPVRLTEPGRTFRLEIEQISKAMAAGIPERLIDLLEIASYVFAADQSITRGGDTRRNWGEDWRRSMHFAVPVRDVDFWRQDEVTTALTAALSFLSEDNYRFAFMPSTAPATLPDYLPLDAAADGAFSADDVVLFSGGLDSLAGAIETLAQTDRRVALVSHRSAQKVLSYQRALAGALQLRFPERVFPIQIYATRRGGGEARDRSQRSRSFLYLALGFVVAQMFRAKRLRLFENGVVSINLPFSEQIVGAMATRTTHPHAVRLIRELLSRAAGETINLENPFIWHTKADVFKSLRQHGGADLVRHSISCSDVHAMSKSKTHCGDCSQCLDRRFAALAAGMEADDPADMYLTDVLHGPRARDRDRIMALDFARHAVGLADMTEIAFFSRFAGELSRVIEGFPAEPVNAVGERCYRLLTRHGEAVKGVLAEAVAAARWEIVGKELPATSLLQAYIAGEGGPVAPVTLLEVDTPAVPSREARKPLASLFPLQIRLDRELCEARIIDVDTLKGRQFALLQALADRRHDDLASGRLLDDYMFVSANELADALHTDVENVRQLIRRTRRGFARTIALIDGQPPTDDALIETRQRRGYRLHPEVRIVGPAEP